MLRIVGLGPGDPDLLTLGSREALRAVGRAVTVLAPPDLVLFLESEGVAVLRGMVTDQGLFVRGSTEVIDGFVERLDGSDLALGILGNPLSDFAGLPMLLRALERRRIVAEIVPGMPRATLSASITLPLKHNVNCASLTGSFSDFGPNCSRFSFATRNSRCSIRAICAITRWLNAVAPIFSISSGRACTQIMHTVCHELRIAARGK